MERTIKINEGQSLRVSNNIGWMLAYRDQFGRDIVPALIPALTAIVDVTAEIMKATAGKNVKAQDVVAVMDPDILKNALVEASGLEAVDLIHIVWAMAKTADESIEEPREWVKQFDTFPVDIIGPIIIELVIACMVSEKNSRRLRTAMEGLKPSTSTTSSSQDEGQA